MPLLAENDEKIVLLLSNSEHHTWKLELFVGVKGQKTPLSGKNELKFKLKGKGDIILGSFDEISTPLHRYKSTFVRDFENRKRPKKTRTIFFQSSACDMPFHWLFGSLNQFITTKFIRYLNYNLAAKGRPSHFRGRLRLPNQPQKECVDI